MRAPQYGRVDPKPGKTLPAGPNPAAAKGLRVEPFAKIFALVDGLGCISLHKTREEADAALAAQRAKRHQAETQGQHRPG